MKDFSWKNTDNELSDKQETCIHKMKPWKDEVNENSNQRVLIEDCKLCGISVLKIMALGEDYWREYAKELKKELKTNILNKTNL